MLYLEKMIRNMLDLYFKEGKVYSEYEYEVYIRVLIL